MTKTGAAARPHLDLAPESFVEALQHYRKPITAGVIVLAAAIGGLWLWKRSGEIKEVRAAAAYSVAEAAFGAGNAPLAQPELEKVVSRYAGTSAGTQAAMLLAQILYDQGKFADGISQLEAALAKAPDALEAGTLALIGSGHEGVGASAEAAAAFDRAAQAAEFGEDRDMYRMSAARNHVAAGNVAVARSIYEDIALREDASYAGEAKLRLGELMGKA